MLHYALYDEKNDQEFEQWLAIDGGRFADQEAATSGHRLD